MGVHRASFLVLLIVLGTFLLVRKVENADAKHCTRNCDPRIDHAICARSEENRINPICTNCCAGMKGCNYYSADRTFICEGETEVGKPRGCPRNCDPRIDHAICPRSEEKKTNQICTNCCAGMKGCNYYSADGTFICEGETEVGKPRSCPRNCDPRIDHAICPRSEEKKTNQICTNCCAGMKGCNYYSTDGTFICEGETEEGKPRDCPRNCDPRIDHAICPRSEGKKTNQICTNCCARMKGCNYYSANGTFICEGKTEVGKPRGCPRNCDPRINHAICPRSEEKKTNQICTNCCAGMKGCNYYSADETFICEGETEVGKPRSCPRNCDPRIDHAICPRSEEKKTNQICTNCCAGMKGCNYYSADGTFICEGETEVGKPRSCPRNCDPRIDHAICPRSEEEKTNQICTNCCAGMKGCNYYSADGTFICEGETEEGKPRDCPRNCDPRIDHAICPRSEEKKTNQICTNCCAGMKGCNYYSADGTFVCEGETEVGKPKGCPGNCDARIAYGFCLRSEETRINKICTNCCAGKNSCNYFSSNGTFICKGESGVKTIEEVERPKPCTLECDPGVAYMTCPLLGLAKLKQVCVNCCTAGDGCKLYGHDGSLISCPKEL